MFFNNIQTAINAAKFLCSLLPKEHQHHIKWFFWDMSDEFKETEADRLVKGETWGLMTMDLFGMVGLFIYFRDKYSNTSQGMNIPDI